MNESIRNLPRPPVPRQQAVAPGERPLEGKQCRSQMSLPGRVRTREEKTLAKGSQGGNVVRPDVLLAEIRSTASNQTQGSRDNRRRAAAAAFLVACGGSNNSGSNSGISGSSSVATGVATGPSGGSAVGSSAASGANSLIYTPVDTSASGKVGGVLKHYDTGDIEHFDALIANSFSTVQPVVGENGAALHGSRSVSDQRIEVLNVARIVVFQHTSASGKVGGVLKHYDTGDIEHFDALIANSFSTVQRGSVFAYNRLLKFKSGLYPNIADGSSEGEMAESWEISPDKLTVTMKLRQGQRRQVGRSRADKWAQHGPWTTSCSATRNSRHSQSQRRQCRPQPQPFGAGGGPWTWEPTPRLLVDQAGKKPDATVNRSVLCN